MNRDVSVREYVVALLKAVDAALPDRLSAETMAALIRAYASPALVAPPAVDPGARVALEALAAEGALPRGRLEHHAHAGRGGATGARSRRDSCRCSGC